MTLLRPLSARPELLTGVVDPANALIGTAGPFGRARVIYALPLNGSGPVQFKPARMLQTGTDVLADPDGNVLGDVSPVWISRILYARPSEDTRRL